MTVFKTFLKILNKCKAPIIIYTVFLVFFGGFNLKANESNTNFTATKPNVLIVNKDTKEGITKSLINYIEKNATIKDVKEDENSIKDALFYRDVNYIIYIPKNYRHDFFSGKNPTIEIKSTKDYNASLADMMLNRYLNVVETYKNVFTDEDKLIEKVEEILSKNVEIEVTSTLDTTALEKASTFYNFTNYCILAGNIYVICLILASFKNYHVNKRIIVSSTNYRTFNIQLLLSNFLFAIFLWLMYVLLSIILLGNIMFSMHGLLYMLNSLIFTFCSLTIAFLIGSLVTNKEAINGIVNVIALGSSFLCGAFVPASFLPDSVLKIAHILPSFWFINTNEILKELEHFNFINLKPIIINSIILLLFSLLFILLSNTISRKKRKLS